MDQLLLCEWGKFFDFKNSALCVLLFGLILCYSCAFRICQKKKKKTGAEKCPSV